MSETLGAIVALYRAAGLPQLDGSRFAARLPLGAGIHALISRLRNAANSRDGHFEHLSVDGDELFENDDLPAPSQQDVSFEWHLAGQGECRFISNRNGFIETYESLRTGQFPGSFYVVSDDYNHGEDKPQPEWLNRVSQLCELIALLRRLSDYRDENSRLVYLSDSIAHSTIIEPVLNDSLLNINELDFEFLRELVASSEANSIHTHEKRVTFRLSLSEYLHQHADGAQDSFQHLVLHLDSFKHVYISNLQTYLSGFTFETKRREVADAQIRFAEQIAKVVGDMTGKMLGVPVALIASFGMVKATGWIEQVVFLVGAFLASLVIFFMARHYHRQHLSIEHSKELVFGGLDTKARMPCYPEELASALGNASLDIDRSIQRLRCTICFYQVAAWIPTVAALVIFIHMHHAKAW